MKRAGDERSSVRRPYRTPALKVHGSFRELTAAKEGINADGSGKPKTKTGGQNA